jgi:hypothetical protein
LGRVSIKKSEAQDTKAILALIQQLLGSVVRPAARQAGLIPVYEKQGGEPLFGDVPAADMFEAVRKIQDAGQDVTVTVVAPKDIYSADQLQVEFRIVPELKEN